MAHERLIMGVAALALAVAGLGALAAEGATSGLQVGEGTPAYNVQDVTGLAKGGKICYV